MGGRILLLHNTTGELCGNVIDAELDLWTDLWTLRESQTDWTRWVPTRWAHATSLS